jgi:PAS domain S-box-containing protein
MATQLRNGFRRLCCNAAVPCFNRHRYEGMSMLHPIIHKRWFSYYQWLTIAFIVLFVIVCIGWFVTSYLGDKARQEIIKDNESAISILSTYLTGELKKIEGAVKIMAGSPVTAQALIFRKDQDIALVNSALDRYTTALDASVSYIMDSNGLTIASSNRKDQDSFVGKSYNFRPYFTQAMNGNPGRYFAVGVTSLKRGFYSSYPVKDRHGSVVGVAAVKKDLDEMETHLRNYPLCFVVNRYGIIFLSSRSDMLLKSLWPVHPDVTRKLLTTKQFGDKSFDAILPQEVADGTEIFLYGNKYFISRNAINYAGWSIVLMTSTDRIAIYKSVGIIVTLLICLCVILPYAVTYQTVRSAEAVKRSEERFQQVVQSSQDWIWETDREGQYTYSSQAVKHILDYTPEEIIGKHYCDFYVPEEKEELNRTFKGFFDRKEAFFRVVNKRVHRDGRQIFVESTGVPLLDAEGKVVGYRGTNRDITEQRQAEKELLQAHKMEAIGTLAGGIAHDFNNLLMGIQGYSSLMLLGMGANHPKYDKLKRIEELVIRGSDLTRQLLGFARGGKYEIKPTDLNDIINSTTDMFGRTKKEISIHQNLQEGIWPVEVDQGQIGQVLVNLYVNAGQAMPAGGDLHLETQNVTLDEKYARSYSMPPGNYVKISITDTGVGMDAKTKERIFEPFFTTKEMGRGTGLGLATVYGIIKGHNGIINVYSEKDQGTTFHIYLPASEKAVIQDRSAPEALLTGHETILLIDDEDIIIDVSREILENIGYKVFVAASGQEALNIYETKREIIDLVILDMIMPEMSGGETFDCLKEIDPGVKVILSSGYSLDGQASEILQRGCLAFIQKPFTVRNLSQKVREVLDIG